MEFISVGHVVVKGKYMEFLGWEQTTEFYATIYPTELTTPLYDANRGEPSYFTEVSHGQGMPDMQRDRMG